jgi:hypothetical protein
MLFELLLIFVLSPIFFKLVFIVNHAFSAYFNGHRAYLSPWRQNAAGFDLDYGYRKFKSKVPGW